MHYSICQLESGRTLRTAFAPYGDDDAPLAEANIHVSVSPIVEVWKDNLLVARLYQDPEGAVQ